MLVGKLREGVTNCHPAHGCASEFAPLKEGLGWPDEIAARDAVYVLSKMRDAAMKVFHGASHFRKLALDLAIEISIFERDVDTVIGLHNLEGRVVGCRASTKYLMQCELSEDTSRGR